MIRPVFIYAILNEKTSVTEGFKVILSHYFDWVPYSSSWMDDKELGKDSLIPDIDISEQEFVLLAKDFENLGACEEAAFKKVAELYALQLK